MTTAHPGPATAASDIDEAAAALRSKGLRISAARRLVLEALFAADGPVSAERIAEGIGDRVPPSDLASVYRNLETLERLGLVRHFHAGHGPGLYSLAAEGREHLVCERCAKAVACKPGDLDHVRELIREQHDFEAQFSHFPIVGLCGECARSYE